MLKKELITSGGLKLLEKQKVSFRISSLTMYSNGNPEQDCFIDGKKLSVLSMQWAGDDFAYGFYDGNPYLRVLFENSETPNRQKIVVYNDKTTVVTTLKRSPTTGRMEFRSDPVEPTEEDKMLFTGKNKGEHLVFTLEAWGGGKIHCLASNYGSFARAA